MSHNTNNSNSNNNNSTSLTEGIPPNWVASLRPFLQRADEFESRVPIVAYFLRTHAAFLAMQLHKQQKTAAGNTNNNSNNNNNNNTNNNSENAALCKQYLLRLLNTLEQQKQHLGDALANVDGRTILTRYALLLFSQADDAERSGAGASTRLMQLFFTASLLFDATAQFTPDGCVDQLAAEKRNYARYIAVRMKRALDNGTPYESPNKMEMGECDDPPVVVLHDHNNEEEEEESGKGKGGKEERNYNHMMHMHSNSNSNNNNMSNSNSGLVGKDTPPPPPPPPVVTTTSTSTMPPPPSYSTLRPTPTQPPQNNWSYNHNNNNNNNNMNTNTAVSSNSGNNNNNNNSGNEPSMEAMLAAQKYCKQAVSALQFYDHASARQQLISALNALDGKLKK